MYCKFLIILFLTFIFFIKIIVVICNSTDIKEIEEDCLFVEWLENSDDNLLDKLAYTEDEAYNLYSNYALQIFLVYGKESLDILMGQRT